MIEEAGRSALVGSSGQRAPMQPQGQEARSTGRADGRGSLVGGFGDAGCPLGGSRAVGHVCKWPLEGSMLAGSEQQGNMEMTS